MAGAVSDYAEKALLDWICGGAAPPSAPGTHAVGLATSAPTDASPYEIGSGSGVTRQNPGFAAAASPAGSASNGSAMTFGPFSSACTVIGVQLWDRSDFSGNMLWYGTLATARTMAIGDSLVINAASLVVTLD